MAVQEKFYELDSAGLSAAQIAIVRDETLTEEQLDRARRLLEDGASVNETARTIGCANKTLSRRWPEFACEQCAEFSAIIARVRKPVTTGRRNRHA